jgi:HNH endonuclease
MVNIKDSKKETNNCLGCNKPNKIVARGLCDTCWRRDKIGPIPLIDCACGNCNEKIPAFNIRGKPQKFAHGHNFYVQENPRKNDGSYTDKQGHLMLKALDHPYVDSRGYVRKNRLEFEKYTSEKAGCSYYLHPSKGIEHIDGNKNNFDISNLRVVDRGNKWRMAGTVKSDRRDRNKSFICIKCSKERRQYSGDYCETCYRRMKQLQSPFKKCECRIECTALISSKTFDGKERRFAIGHNMFGEKNPKWKGGVRIDKDGYRYILNKEHPFCDYAGYVPEHRLVLEKKLGRYLIKGEIAHHINEIVDDNRPENIELKNNTVEHLSSHDINRSLAPMPMKDRVCLLCGSKDTYKNSVTGKPVWYLYENRGYICKNCYKKNLKIKRNEDLGY